MIWYKKYKTAEVTLYHGTTLKNAISIMKSGLIPGAGEFVKEMYIEYLDQAKELPDISFAADKTTLNKAVTAMRMQVAYELGYSWMDKVSSEELKKRGAIVVFSGESGSREAPQAFQHREEGDKEWEERYHSEEYPTVEPGDYFAEHVTSPSYYMTGERMYKFLESFGLWPLSIEEMKKKLINKMMSDMVAGGLLNGKEIIKEVIRHINSLTRNQIVAEFRKKYPDYRA